jgi:hypothetical protein
MGISPTIPLICGLLLLLGWQVRGLLAQIHRLEQLIQDSREREQKLIDRMLTKSGFAPIIEREQVVKLADPEIKQPDFIEAAFREDGIMEEVEMLNPEMAGRGVEYVKQVYPSIWDEAERRYNAMNNPMRL